MKMFSTNRIHTTILAVVAVGTSVLLAQQTRTAPRDGARQNKKEHFDQHVAQCLTLSGQNEVAAAKIAESKSDDSDVKRFAQMMVKDHDQFIADLEKFAGQNYRRRDARTGTTTTAEAAAGTDKAAAARDSNTNTNDGDHMAKFMKIREEIADQCRASVQRELDAKQGKLFDQCYMGMQVAAHMQMVDELTVLSRHVSSEFKPVLEKGLKTAQHHLDEAKNLIKEVSNSRSADTTTTKAK